jgi:polyisoprenoid-binding protein YceI
MFRNVLIAILIFGLFVLTPSSGAAPLEIDKAHSTVGFNVPMLGGLSKVSGKFTDFTINIDYDEKDITKSSVSTVIKATSIDTGIEGRDRHLRTPDFFDVEKYPEITFKSKSVVKKGKMFIAIGDFSMHGVTKEISIPFTVSGKFVDPKTNKTIYGFNATLKLDRRDYGIVYQNQNNPSWIGYEVEINLSILTRPA